MKKVIERAEALAQRQEAPLDSGHLLLALITGTGTTSKLLMNFGITEAKVSAHLRTLGPEPENILAAVVEKAEQMAAPIASAEPTPLHLMAALTSVRGSLALLVFQAMDVDTQKIRNWVLRCLTRPSEQLDLMPSHRKDTTAALPLAEPLKNITAGPVNRTLAEPAFESNEVRPADDMATGFSPIQARRLIDLGREIEQKQRKKKQLQSRKPEILSALPEVIAEATTAPLQAPRIEPSFSSPLTSVSADEDAASAPVRFPLLSRMGRNLSKEAAEGKLDELIGRAREMEQIADVLNKRRANSPLLVGRSGVGKTAVVEGLATKLTRSGAPGLRDRVIIEIRAGDLLTGTSVRGALSERIADLRREITAAEGSVILFFDEIHTLLSSNEGAEAFQELKMALGKGEIPCIAATTREEYARQVQTDPTLARLFTIVEIAEPTEDQAIQILEGVRHAYEAHHEVSFTAESLEAAVKLSARYVNEGALPDKAISLLDLAGASAKRMNSIRVKAEDIARVLAEQIGVPAERLVADDQQRLLNLEVELAERIVGHHHVLAALGETLRRNAAGFQSGRPIGSFLFLGPTGVGKTETAKALGDFLFPGKSAFIRLDMSEFSEAHSVARLIGAPPGYIGHEEGGQLTEAVRRRPYSLILLDEVEKAHQEVQQILLQVLDDGHLTDGLGRTVFFRNTVIVMTSNLGSDLRQQRRSLGFGAARTAEEQRDISAHVIAVARASLPPELWNRIDEPLVFSPLDQTEVADIACMLLRNVGDQLENEHGVALTIDESVIVTLVTSGGYDPDLGARPMRRTIQRYVEGPIAKLLLSGQAVRGDTVVVTGHGENLAFKVKSA